MVLRPIYLDYHATTPLDPRVLEAMLPYLGDRFGNPGSGHLYGWEGAAVVDRARQQIAEAVGGVPDGVVWTSGATEANNLAIKGIAEIAYGQGKTHLITVATEHRAILEPCRYLERLGFTVTYLPVGGDGLLDPAALVRAITPQTALVSVMAANNEIGVLQDLAAIGAICQEREVYFHSDGAQALGKIPLDVQSFSLDLLSLTAHKLCGPKGIGALYVRPGLALAPQLHGGGQEGERRSGTLAPHQIAGFAQAVSLAQAEQPQENHRLRQLRDRLWAAIRDLGGVQLNGHPTQRLPGNLNVSFDGIDGNTLLKNLRPHLALSSGSACGSAQAQPSHVLKAIGLSDGQARASLRFGLGRFTSETEIAQTITLCQQKLPCLRSA